MFVSDASTGEDDMDEQVSEESSTTGDGVQQPLETVERKSLVNPSKVEYGTWGVNHVFGCSHGCLYCYATSQAKVYGRVDTYETWCQPKLVAGAADLVRKELKRKRNPVDRVHLSFTTDPFMWDASTQSPQREIAAVSLEIIQAINEAGIPVTVLTKGVYPDFDVRQLHPNNQYGITAVSLGEAYRQEWEPNTPPVTARMASLRTLSHAGARTWVSVEPYPTPNIDETAGDILPLLEELTFIDKFIFGRLNYTPQVTEYLKSVDATFYERIAADVVEWCASNDKPLHIKRRTPLHDPETATILAV